MQDQIDSNKNDADRNNRQSEVYDPTISPSWYEAGRKADDNNDAQLLSNGGNNNCEMVLNDNDCKYYDEFINKGPNNSMSFDYHDIEHYSANPQQQQMVAYEQPKMVAYEQPQMVAYEQPQMVAYKQPQLVPYEPPQIVVHDKKSEKKLKKTNSGKRRTQGDRRMKNVGSVKDGTKDRKIEETEDDNLEKNGSVDANKNNYQNNNEDGEVCYGYDTNQKKGWCWNFRNKQPIIQDRKKQFHIQ